MSLQVWMPLNGDIDNQGLRGDIIPQMMGTGITFTDGKIGKCANFPNNTNSCIYMTGMELQTGTWCAWIKVLGEGASSSQRIISEGRDYQRIGTNFYVNKAGTTLIFQSHKQALSRSIPLNTWTHIAGTFGDGKIALYINGNKVSSIDYTEDTDYYYSNGELVLGKMSYARTVTTNYFPFNGQICDFRVYDNALSPREVKEISKGLVLHYPLAMPGQENIIANTSHEIACTYPASGVKDYYFVRTKSVPNETQYTLSFEARSTVDGDHLRTHFYNPNTTTTCESSQGIIRTASDGNMDFTLTTEWRRYWVVYTQTETTAIKSVICPRLCSPASYPSSQSGTGTVYVRNQKLEHGSHPTPWIPNPTDAEYSALGFNDGIEYDVSGFCNNGTITGTLTYSTDTPRYKLSTYFANNNYIKFKLPENMYQITYSFWVKADTYNKYNAIVSRFSNPGGGNGGPWLSVNTEYVGAWAYIGNISPNYTKTNIGLLSTGEWHHLCWVFDNGSAKWYVDGQSASNTVTYVTTYLSNTEYSALGNSYTGTNWNGCVFDGYLSDFRVYATPLSADDILKLYNTPITLNNNGTLLTSGEFVEAY